MADKTVGELPRASEVTMADLFVMEQAGQAKSLLGQTLVNDLAKALDAHGGIKTITLNPDYTLTFTFSDDTTSTTTPVRGERGEQGEPGADGVSITGVDKISTDGLVDTYRISFSNGSNTTFTVTNGSDIESVEKTDSSGLVDTYTVTMTDGSTSTFTVTNGNGITGITLESGNHAPGTSDVYKISYANGEYTTFSVYNGLNGSGSVASVNDVPPDINGNVALDAAAIPDGDTTVAAAIDKLSTDTSAAVDELNTKIAATSAALDTKQPLTPSLTAETAIADTDYIPFHDTSAGAEKKSTWANIVAKIRTALFGTANGVLRANGSGVISVETDIEPKKLAFTNKSVAASAFVSNSTYADYPFRASVALTGVTSSMIPDVTFSVPDAVSGNYAPVSAAYDGGVYIYAATKPDAAITIPTIICWRGA